MVLSKKHTKMSWSLIYLFYFIYFICSDRYKEKRRSLFGFRYKSRTLVSVDCISASYYWYWRRRSEWRELSLDCLISVDSWAISRLLWTDCCACETWLVDYLSAHVHVGVNDNRLWYWPRQDVCVQIPHSSRYTSFCCM